MDLFTPNPLPSSSTTRGLDFERYESKFGEGYSQRVGAGINPTRESLSLSWNALTLTDAETIREWLKAKQGAEAFLFQVPLGGPLLSWICPQVSEIYYDSNGASLTATLEEVRDL